MPKTAPTEWLLALIAGRERAVAILGDLTEMALTRGRLWFWMAYARTLVSLGWRTPVAFLIAIASGTFIFGVVSWWPMLWLMHHRRHAWIYAALYPQIHPHFSVFTWILCRLMVQSLFFALPFVLIRFGLRNRLTRLACALLLITLPIYILSPLPRDLSNIFCVLAIAVALLLPLWRRPMIVLAATCIPAVASNVLFLLWTAYVFHAPVPFLYFYRHHAIVFIYEMTTFTLAAIVCLYLYRRLLQRRPITDRNLA
jgi:hypothetical protein